MSRRVVVTGMGAISPIGNDVPTMWKNMVDGVCGIETITAFDTSDLKVHIAGTVKDFDPTQYIEKKEVDQAFGGKLQKLIIQSLRTDEEMQFLENR